MDAGSDAGATSARAHLIAALPPYAHVGECPVAPTLAEAQRCLGCSARYAHAAGDPSARHWYVSARVHARVVEWHFGTGKEPMTVNAWAAEAEAEWDGARTPEPA